MDRNRFYEDHTYRRLVERRNLAAAGTKHEANDKARVAHLVIELSKHSDEHLVSLCGLKMCNRRRAAEKILAWRKSHPSKP